MSTLRRNTYPVVPRFCRRCGQVRRFITRFGLCQRCLANGMLRRYHETYPARPAGGRSNDWAGFDTQGGIE